MFDSGYSLHYLKTLRHPQNRKYITQCTAATSKICKPKELVKYATSCGFSDTQADRQTNKQTHGLTDHNMESEVSIYVSCASDAKRLTADIQSLQRSLTHLAVEPTDGTTATVVERRSVIGELSLSYA